MINILRTPIVSYRNVCVALLQPPPFQVNLQHGPVPRYGNLRPPLIITGTTATSRSPKLTCSMVLVLCTVTAAPP